MEIHSEANAAADSFFANNERLCRAAIIFADAGIRCNELSLGADVTRRAHAITAAFATRVDLDNTTPGPIALAEANRAWREIGDKFFGPLPKEE